MQRQTDVSIRDGKFFINDQPTYQGRIWQGCEIEGLLMNTRMVQGIFDDKNPQTVSSWAYPDTGRWDPERNTQEFVEAMPSWKAHGVLAFTINLQGGSPEGYSKAQPWHNSAFSSDSSLDPDYMGRLERIIDRADALGMVVILGCFYFGQDIRLSSERAVKQAVVNVTTWVHQRGYTNVIIEIANECDIAYKHKIILAPRIHELIELARLVSTALNPERPLLIGTSFCGGQVPSDNVIESSDVLFIHGNDNPLDWVTQQIELVRNRAAYRGQPIVNNEDDHFDFHKETNHMVLTVKSGASWGYFDPGLNNYTDGYQCPPINWGLNTERKRAFFSKLKEITGV